MSSYQIDFNARRLQIFIAASESGDPTPLLEPSESMDSIQEGLDSAMRHVANATNSLDRRGQPAWEKLKKAINSGALPLLVRGEPRELYVAALHLRAGYNLHTPGFCGCDPSLPGVEFVPSQSGPSFYETYHFDLDTRPLEELAERAYNYLNKNGQLSSSWGIELRLAILPELGISVDSYGRARGAPIRLGVMGVTGAGKSTFINALLGRRIVPQHEEICTACVVEIRHAEEGGEGIRVQWHSREEIDRRLAAQQDRLTTERLKHAAQRTKEIIVGGPVIPDGAEPPRSPEALAAEIEEARAYSYELDRLHPLIELGRFADRNQHGVLHRLVKGITVYLRHPLLRHISLVDTPGLRDPDDTRRRAALDEVSKMDGYLYLVEAAQKENESTRLDWRAIEEHGKNKTGVLVLAKVDQLLPETVSLMSALQRRVSAYQRMGWSGDIVFCAGRGPALMTNRAEGWQRRMRRVRPFLELVDNLFNTPVEEKARCLEHLAAHPDVQSDEAFQTGIVDYVLETSGTPRCVRRLSTIISREILAKRLRLGAELLRGDAEERRQQTQERADDLQRQLNNCDSLTNTRLEAQRCEEEAALLERDIPIINGALELFKKKAAELVERQRIVLMLRAEALRDEVERSCKNYADSIPFLTYVDELSFPVFDQFDVPLARAAARENGEFLKLLSKAQELHHLSQVQPRHSKLTNLHDEEILRSLVEDVLTSFKPHRQVKIEDQTAHIKVGWLEFFSGAKRRLAEKVDASMRQGATTVHENSMKILALIMQRIIDVAVKPLDEKRARLQQVQVSQREISEILARLESGTEGQSAAEIAGRLNAVNHEIALYVGFAVEVDTTRAGYGPCKSR